MRMLTSPPSPTAAIACCPQCGATMRIKLIEPDPREPRKARHVFECKECCLPRTYAIERPAKANYLTLNYLTSLRFAVAV